MAKTIISLAEAAQRLGEDVVICLEPDEVLKKKIDDSKGQELWVFDPKLGRTGRGDDKFFDVRMNDWGGYHTPIIHEEPGTIGDGGARVVGHVIVEFNTNGLVRMRETATADGSTTVELLPSSLSKGETAEDEEHPIGHIYANTKRIDGLIAVYVREDVNFLDEEGLDPADFVTKSTCGGKSVAALAKAMVHTKRW